MEENGGVNACTHRCQSVSEFYCSHIRGEFYKFYFAFKMYRHFQNNMLSTSKESFFNSLKTVIRTFFDILNLIFLRLCMNIFMYVAKQFCRRLICESCLYKKREFSMPRSVRRSVGLLVRPGKLTSSYRRTYMEGGGEKMGEGQGQYVDGDGEAKRGWDRLRRENYCIWGGGRVQMLKES